MEAMIFVVLVAVAIFVGNLVRFLEPKAYHTDLSETMDAHYRAMGIRTERDPEGKVIPKPLEEQPLYLRHVESQGQRSQESGPSN